MLAGMLLAYFQSEYIYFLSSSKTELKGETDLNRSKRCVNGLLRRNISEVLLKQRSWELLDCLHNLDPDWSRGGKKICKTHTHTLANEAQLSSLLHPHFSSSPLSLSTPSFKKKKVFPHPSLLYSLPVLPQSIHLALSDPVSSSVLGHYVVGPLHSMALFSLFPLCFFLFFHLSTPQLSGKKSPRETKGATRNKATV